MSSIRFQIESIRKDLDQLQGEVGVLRSEINDGMERVYTLINRFTGKADASPKEIKK